MTYVTLPTMPGPASAVPRLLDYHGVQKPFLGGPVNHIFRMGTRFALEVQLPAMKNAEAAARAWIADLLRGKRDGVIWEFPQPDFIPTPRANFIHVAALAGAETLVINGFAAGEVVPRGAFLTLNHGGRRYLHNMFTSTVAEAGGVIAVEITPPLRVPATVGDVIERTPPMIQGYLDGDDASWTLELARTVGLQFVIVEEE